MSDWKRCKWGDLASLEYGKALRNYQETEGRFPVYGTNGPIGWHAAALCDKPGVIIGRKGAYRGVHYSSQPFYVIDTAFYLRPKLNVEIDVKWAYYALLFQDINSMDSGSAIPSTSREEFYQLPVNLPPLPEQKAIASILGSLDDKIELNRRMNATLEALAQTLFRAWFVDFEPVKAKATGLQPVGLDPETAALFPSEFEESSLGLIPKGWKVGALNDIIEFALGGDWGKDEPIGVDSQKAYCIRGADIPYLQAGGVGMMPLRHLKTSSANKRALRPEDLVIEISGGSPTQSTGRPVLISESVLRQLGQTVVCSNFCRIVRLRDTSYARYVYLWLRDLYSKDVFLQYENGTTGIKNFAFNVFSQQNHFLMPPQELLLAFESVVKPSYNQLQHNGEQSRTLANLRDSLLPRLISGQLRVPEAAEMVQTASV